MINLYIYVRCSKYYKVCGYVWLLMEVISKKEISKIAATSFRLVNYNVQLEISSHLREEDVL